MSTNAVGRALAAAGMSVALAVLGGGACGGTGEEAPPAMSGPTQRVVTVEVRNGTVVRGAARIEARVGEEVRIVVRSDVADEVHVHGYERRAEVPAGGEAVLVFLTDIPGVFEVELEGRHLALAELRVSP